MAIDNYLPDFNNEERRANLQQFNREDLIEMLLMAYKNARVMAVTADLYSNRMERIRAITEESSLLPSINRPPPNFPGR